MAATSFGKSQTENFASFIWAVADTLRGPFQEDDYGNIILPFALLRRLECVLEPTRSEVADLVKLLNFQQDSSDDSLIKAKANAPFFNVTSFTLASLGETHTLQNIIQYKNGFSENVRKILDKFDFDAICAKLEEKDKLYSTILYFKNIDLSPSTVPARAMSNLYEELIWRFATTKHKASKEFLTPRDIVRLATMLVLDSAGDAIFSSDKGLIRSIYDPTCGTCGFISDAMDVLAEHAANVNATAPVTLLPFGQEIANQSWAMGKAMMLLTSSINEPTKDNSANIFVGDTLKLDKTGSRTFDFVLSNPPFGSDWGGDTTVWAAVNHEHQLGTYGRFAAGVPPKSDASMLFLQIVANKLNPKTVNEGGRGAIVLSGSPLFTGGAGSGSSEIRRWLFEDDLVEAIIQLPGELFYNTGITTYLWILNTNKPANRTNLIQLIDASGLKTPIKNLGNKRYEISPDQINEIVRVFADFKESEISKIVPYRDFGYRAVTIQRPLRKKIVVTADGINALLSAKALQKLSEAERLELQKALQLHVGKEHTYLWPAELASELKKSGLKIGKPIQTALQNVFGITDAKYDVVKDDKGNIIWDPDLKQIENIPLNEDVESYVMREVLPFVPDATVDDLIRDERDGQIGTVGYEVNFNQYFYKYIPLRNPADIERDILVLEDQASKLMQEIFK